jgi:hypothetical protein
MVHLPLFPESFHPSRVFQEPKMIHIPSQPSSRDRLVHSHLTECAPRHAGFSSSSLIFSVPTALAKRCEAGHSPIVLAALSTVKTFLSGIAAHNASIMLATIIPSGSAVLSLDPTILYLNLTAVVERIPFSEARWNKMRLCDFKH